MTKRIKPPGSGRKKGTPNKATTEVAAFCRSIVLDPHYLRTFAARAKAGKLPPNLEAMLWHYSYGKPREHVTLDAPEPVRITFGGRYKAKT